MSEETKAISLEDRIVQVLRNKLNDGTIEEKAEKYAEQAIETALDNVFGRYNNGLSKSIEEHLKSILTPVIEGYNFSEHTVKLEALLNDLLTQIQAPHDQVLKSFRGILDVPRDRTVKLTELAKKYQEYVAETFETSGREIDSDDDEPVYVPVQAEVRFEGQGESEYSWLSQERASIVFEVTEGIDNEDELRKLNFFVPIRKISDEWHIRELGSVDITDLRYLSEFEVFLRMLNQHFISIEIDEAYIEETVYSNTQPEYTLE